MRNNCKLGIRQMMVTYQPATLNDFIEQGKRCDKLLIPQSSYYHQPRKVNEIQVPPGTHSDPPSSVKYPHFDSQSIIAYPITTQVDPAVSIEVLKSQNVLKCWNCDEIGHRWMDCGKNRVRTFCYRCGNKDTTSKDCERCKHFIIQEIVTGVSPHQAQSPDLNLPTNH